MSSETQFHQNGKFARKRKVENTAKYLAGMAEARREKRESQVNKISQADVISGYRFVDLCELGRNLHCLSCEKILSLVNIVSEKILGLHSVSSVRCHECGIISPVATGKTDGRLAHINKTIILGSLHSGAGCVTTNKILACADIPGISAHTYKRYGRIVGVKIEESAKGSCLRVAHEERRLTIKNIFKFRTGLPKEIADQFSPDWDILIEILNIVMNALKNGIIDREIFEFLYSSITWVVKILASYDMGWSKRGNGKSYNSLNGYATLIDYCTQEILDYTTRDRKCRACAMGSAKEDHDCRHNSDGSAQAMEADAGVQLVLLSGIMQKTKLAVGVLIGDEDSSLMSAIHEEDPTVTIFELADKNHLVKNFGKELYELAKSFKELNRKGVIDHIKKCSAYAVAQNKGKTGELSKTLRTIPDHMFNEHEKCASWYKSGNSVLHSMSLHDTGFQTKLSTTFEKYAQNAKKFAVSASSQSNESVNNTIAHKAHTNKCLSQSEACDYRVASSMCVRNDGDRYVLEVKKKLGIPAGKHTARYFTQLYMIRKKEAEKSVLVPTEQQRLKLKAAVDLLRKKNGKQEGLKYKSNCGMQLKPLPKQLVECPENVKSDACDSGLNEKSDACDNELINRIVYFDLELGDLYPDAALLQIAAKYVNRGISVYVTPTKAISPAASNVNGLRYISGSLYFHDEVVPALSLTDALKKFLEFLEPDCILVAHNALFDLPRSIRAVIGCGMEEDFPKVSAVSGSLSLLRKKIPDRKGAGMFKLRKLAEDSSQDVDVEEFHAMYDVRMLEKIVKTLKIEEALVQRALDFQDCIIKYRENEEVNSNLPSSDELEAVLHRDTLRKMTRKKVTFESLRLIYIKEGKAALEVLSARLTKKISLA